MSDKFQKESDPKSNPDCTLIFYAAAETALFIIVEAFLIAIVKLINSSQEENVKCKTGYCRRSRS